MSESRIGLKVGVFVFIGLALLGTLVVLLSKGTTFTGKHMTLKLKSDNVSGIKRGANIYMSGVSIGRVSGVELGEEGTNVIIFLNVEASRKIYSDAVFLVEQQGFLGDQYVGIHPGKNAGHLLKDGEEVVCRAPFNLMETVAEAVQIIRNVGQVTTNVNAAVTDVRTHILTEQRLSQLGASIENFAHLVTDAQTAVSNINGLVASNTQPVTVAVSNLSVFAAQLPALANYVSDLVMSNETGINVTVENLQTTAKSLTNLMAGLESGQGAAGRLLRDEQLAADLSAIARNLSITTSNLNTRGLWGILWRQKAPPAPRESSGKNDVSSPKNK